MTELILGLGTGIVFGALLQQGRVLRFEKQVGAMLLKDMTILKFMLSAIIVGMIGIYVLVGADLIELKIKATNVGANIIGGPVRCRLGFRGILSGYGAWCPGRRPLARHLGDPGDAGGCGHLCRSVSDDQGDRGDMGFIRQSHAAAGVGHLSVDCHSGVRRGFPVAVLLVRKERAVNARLTSVAKKNCTLSEVSICKLDVE